VIIHLWNFEVSSQVLAPPIARLMAVACVFALPITDTTTVFFKRLFIQRKSPFKGGKDHTTHHLSYLGVSDRDVALIFTGLSIINSIAGILALLVADKWNSFHTLAFGSWFVLEFSVLFVITNLNTKRDETQ
jgi:UDP-GlcNAc:undecaprenyl-phosphate/decaprenyl-phosphate GlcNAc-1-phosphate transferase